MFYNYMQNSIRKIKRHWQLYLIILLPFIYLVIFKYIPMIGLQIAFKDFMASGGIFGSPWVGFKHFRYFFKSPMCLEMIANTAGISFYYLIAGFPLPIILALSLNEVGSKGFKKTVQMVTYAPYFISLIVIVSILMKLFDPSAGVVNNLIVAFGGEKIHFFAEPRFFKTLYVWSAIWQYTGYSSIIYLAVLSGINPELHEAALVDGANKLQRILNINIPGIMPTAIILLILNVGQIMNVGFEKVFLMQNPLNMQASEVLTTYVYRVGLTGGQFSFAAAIGFFNSVINLILLIIVNELAKKLGDTSLW